MLKQEIKRQNGITLIALIITIIVMLILVGVSVTVALNGGLFTTAKNAVDRTGEEKDREMVLSEGQIEIGGKIYNSYQDYLDKEPESNAPDALLDYILGEKDETTGQRPGRESSEFFSLNNGGFIEERIPDELKDGNLTVVTYVGVSTEVVEKTDSEGNTTYEIGINMDFYFTYEDTMYKFRARLKESGTEGPTLAEAGVKDLSYDTTSKVGKYVSYDGKDWIVLYDDSENGLQMISADVIKDENNEVIEYNLGRNDTTFTESEVTEIDGVVSEKSYLEKSMYSYSRAVTTLNKICEDSVTLKAGVIKGVRSVGSNPTTPNEDNSKPFIGSKYTIPGYGTSTWFEDNLNLQLNKTEEKTYYTTKGTSSAQEYTIKDTDYNYEKDFDRMVALGITEADNDYWLASSIVYSNSSNVVFSMRYVYGGLGGSDYLWGVNLSKADYDSGYCAVRPVVSLESGILDGKTETGLIDDPIKLD